MKIKKADWLIVKEAEKEGLMVAMTSLVERNKTNLNEELSNYFRKKLPKYKSAFDEYESEDILYSINEYLKENNIDKHLLDFPISGGVDVHLIPIGENIQLKIVVSDEYFGDGMYEKFVLANFFMINENTTKEDVDMLISFIKKYLV